MDKKPNIIYLFFDELRTDALGCYGNPYTELDTPHIDSIAENGVLFNNCYCNSPVCVPSRMSIMTGLYPEDTGVYHNEAAWKNFKLDKEFITFPEVLAKNGYQTVSFGKTHLPEEIHPFQHENSEGGGMKWGRELDKDEVQLITPGGHKGMIGGRFLLDKEYPPEKVTQNALEWIKTAEEPYFARISYLQPHTPVFPKPPFDMKYYGRSFPKVLQLREHVSIFEKRFSEVVDSSTLNEEEIYLAQVYYYGLVAWIDEQVGIILDYLKDSNKLDNTIIIFGADHGASLGEGGCYAKHIFAPQSHKVPLIISYPKKLPKGIRKESICENLSLAKTLFALVGIENPKQFKGQDLFSSENKEEVYGTIGFGHKTSKGFPNREYGTYINEYGWPRRACIRTQKYRLDKNIRINGIPASKQDEDIFFVDVTKDKEEITNMLDWKAYETIVDELLNKLNEHIKDCLEPKEELCCR